MKTQTVRPWERGPLAVAQSGRSLKNGEKPFFWMADTAWLLFKQLNLEQSRAYLQNRRGKGFTVIQAMLLHVLPHTNFAGREPFTGGDMARPDTEGPDSYWNHVDSVLDMAEALGLYVAWTPAWGTNAYNGWLTEQNVAAYTLFLAKRYGGRPNIIWMVGGDTLGGENTRVWDTMGETLRAHCPGQLITFHPFGATASSQWFHTRHWLDFNMFQSGHSSYAQTAERRPEFERVGRKTYGEDNWRFVADDLALNLPKPTVDAEPCYERILKGLHGVGHDYWGAPDIRRFAYWSVFAGAMGFTYGHNAIMQFRSGGPVGAFRCIDDWEEALHHPAANQMGHLRRLMEDIGFEAGQPAQGWLQSEAGSLQDRVLVLGGDAWALAYTPTGRALQLNPPFAKNRAIQAEWFDPVSGVYSQRRVQPYWALCGGRAARVYTAPPL